MALQLILQLLALTAAAAPAPVAVRMEPAIELISVVEYLAAPAYHYKLAESIDHPLVREADKRFGRLRAHEAVLLTAELDEKGFDPVTRRQFLLGLGAPPELKAQGEPERWVVEKAGGMAALDRWLESLREFAKASDFASYFYEEQKALAAPVDALAAAVRERDFHGQLEAYTGLAYRGDYTLAPSLFHPEGATVNHVVDRADGSHAIWSIVGPQPVKGGKVVYDADALAGTFWHEYSHGLLDAFAEENWDRIAAAAPLYDILKKPCYAAWKRCVQEHAVRAVKNRLIEKRYGAAAARRDLEDEAGHGMAYLPEMTAALKAYEKDRKKYPTLKEFFPRWLDTLDAQLKAKGLKPALREAPGKVEVRMHPSIELLAVVELLGAGRHKFRAPESVDHPLAAEALKRFAALKDHPAVVLTAALDGKDFDMVTRRQLLLDMGEPPALEVLVPASDWAVAKAGGRESLDKWLQALRDFAKASDFASFYKEDVEAMRGPVRQLTEDIARRDDYGRLARYTGMTYAGDYIVVPSLFHLPGSTTNSVVESGGGRYIIWSVVGPETVKGGKVWFDADGLAKTFWHEYSHGLFDPLTSIYWDRIEPASPLFKRLQKPCYGAWKQCYHEHVVRAVKNRLVLHAFGPEAAARDLHDEEDHGFAYLAPMVDLMADYEAARAKYPTLEDFFSRWVDQLPGLLEQHGLKPVLTRDAQSPDLEWTSHATRTFLSEDQRRIALRHLDDLLARTADPALYRLRGAMHYEAGRSTAALADADAALKLKIEPEALLLKGLTLQLLGQVDAGQKAVAEAAELCQKQPEAGRSQACVDPSLVFRRSPVPVEKKAQANRLIESGVQLYLRKDYNAALSDFDKALGILQDDPRILQSRGVTLHALARYDDALKSYDSALEALKGTDPRLVSSFLSDVLSSRASLWTAMGKPENARKDLERSKSLAK